MLRTWMAERFMQSWAREVGDARGVSRVQIHERFCYAAHLLWLVMRQFLQDIELITKR